jgi:hypothetical protein
MYYSPENCLFESFLSFLSQLFLQGATFLTLRVAAHPRSPSDNDPIGQHAAEMSSSWCREMFARMCHVHFYDRTKYSSSNSFKTTFDESCAYSVCYRVFSYVMT